jgi:cystathionine beta-lyase
MSSSFSRHINTILQHAGTAPFNPETGAAPVALPSMRTSTVRFENLAALEDAQKRKSSGARAVTYGRAGMDTHEALETLVAQLEGGTHCYLASSGLAAITLTFLSLLSAGDHALVSDSVYGPVRYLDDQVLARMNIELTYFSAGEDIATLVRPTTRLVYIESPGSLLFEMLDLPALADQAHKLGLLVVADNTWGSGYVYRPLALGADVSVIAGTKYLGGHSDLMLGTIVAKDAAVAERLSHTHYAMGTSVSADDVWLALRGARTMPVRMTQQSANALEVCRFLSRCGEVSRIHHPAWPADAGHALWTRDCSGSNGMLAVRLKFSPQQARRFVDALALFSIGFSWGGFESLVQLVDTHYLETHGYWDRETCAVVRLHIGLEAVQDLIADLRQALDIAVLD